MKRLFGDVLFWAYCWLIIYPWLIVSYGPMHIWLSAKRQQRRARKVCEDCGAEYLGSSACVSTECPLEKFWVDGQPV